METVKRKVTYRLYPSRRQQDQMLETLRLHQKLYNAAMEQRVDADKRCGVSLSFSDQCTEWTKLHQEVEGRAWRHSFRYWRDEDESCITHSLW